MQSTAIEVESLQKVYRSGRWRRRVVTALEGVTFAVEAGTIFGLLGPNGAGKTTLIKILLGLVRKSGGSASLLGHAAGDLLSRKQVGYLPESHRIPRHLTGNSAMIYYGGLSGLSPAEVKQRRGLLLDRVKLAHRADMSVRSYSKGMLQRLGLAQAMLHNPQLLILDEPTDGVDPVGRTEMRAVLQELKAEGKTVFINSHLLQEVELVCDRVAILVEGKLRRVGSIDELTRRQNADYEFLVRGSEGTIREVFQPTPVSFWQARSVGDGLHEVRLQVPAADQQQINLWVDRLRERQLDLLGLVRLRDSLEQAFLGIVTGSAAAGIGSAAAEMGSLPGAMATAGTPERSVSDGGTPPSPAPSAHASTERPFTE